MTSAEPIDPNPPRSLARAFIGFTCSTISLCVLMVVLAAI